MTQHAASRVPGLYDARTDAVLERLTQLHPKSIDLSLDRIERLLEGLGHPERSMAPAIHIAGTNGKGSVLAFLAAALGAAGLDAHAYTSPHLVRFSERIRLAVAGGLHSISEPYLIDLLEECEAVNEGAPITFFEITTAAAFLAFARTRADYVLLETGLGGRLDATNVLERPAVSVITPVSIDHQSFLGETLAEIAGEKAGILKPGVSAVVGLQEPAALDVIEERAAEIGAPLMVWGSEFQAHEENGRLVYQDDDGLLDLPLPRLVGRHQIANAGIAVATLRALAPPRLREEHIGAGLESAEWPARLERLGPGRLYEIVGGESELWLDGGHNAAAGAVIATAMCDLEERVPRPLRLIVGMMSGKDARQFLAPFAGLADQVVAVGVPNQANSLSPRDIARAAADVGLGAALAASVDDALMIAAGGEEPVRVLITGSLYLAGEVLKSHRGFAIKPAGSGG
jgi:dihydrofolate synthase/folylpolyglutamate synthase